MATRTIGVVIDGATGRLGTTQHLRALLEMRREGGLPLSNGDRLMPEPVLLGRDRGKARRAGRKERRPQMEHRSRRLPGRPGDRPLFRRQRHRRPARARPRRLRRRQARLSRKADRRKPGGRAVAGPRRRARRQKGRRRAGQAVPARPQKAAQALRGRILSAGCCRSGSISAGGYSTANLTAAQRPSWNYRQGDRRRADPRYVRALALHLRPAARPDHRRLVPSRDSAAAPHRRDRPALRCRCRGPRLRDCSNSKAASWRRSPRPGPTASSATTCCRSRSTAPRARRSPGCIAASSSLRSRRRGRFSARKCRRR